MPCISQQNHCHSHLIGYSQPCTHLNPRPNPLKKFLLAAAFLFVSFAGTAAAHAQTLYVNNTVPHAIWVTTYAGKSSRDTIIKAQCFAAHTTGYINASRNEDGAWVLVEFKADPNSCANHSNIAIWEKKAKGKIDTYQYNGRWVFGSN